MEVKLPDFKTEGEEREFWEKHSIADYWEDLRESHDTFERPRLTPVTLKFDPIVLKKIKMLAKKRGIPYNAYIRYLLAKSVEDEIVIRRPQEQ
jgi:predicted DNA binding CopG/RHH family protein